jgi:hypothetical protein
MNTPEISMHRSQSNLDDDNVEADEMEASQSRVGIRKTPYWTKHETVRLLHVINHPSNCAAVRLLCEPANREQLDAGIQDPFTVHFLPMFEDENFKPSHVDATNKSISSLNPTIVVKGHGAKKLADKWREFRTDFTQAYNNWNKSEHNSVDSFVNFIRLDHKKRADATLLYGFLLFEKAGSFDVVLKMMPAECSFEADAPMPSTSSPTSPNSSQLDTDTSSSFVSNPSKKRSAPETFEAYVKLSQERDRAWLRAELRTTMIQTVNAMYINLKNCTDPTMKAKIERKIDESEAALYG